MGLVVVRQLETPPYWEVLSRDKPLRMMGGGRTNDRLRVLLRHKQERKHLLVHRLVYCHMTGAPVPAGFDVHHLNGDRFDNRWENLIALSRRDHEKLHAFQDAFDFKDF
jgi:hypothetical protein